MELLTNAGLDLSRHAREGIPHALFAQSLKGLLQNAEVTWVAFNARYDFGYLLDLIQ